MHYFPLTTVDCITIKASDYPGYRPNFCYEKEWDTASKTEAGIFAAEMVVGVAGMVVAGPEGAVGAYCAASMVVSAGGAWILSGVKAEDKWPNGINQ